MGKLLSAVLPLLTLKTNAKIIIRAIKDMCQKPIYHVRFVAKVLPEDHCLPVWTGQGGGNAEHSSARDGVLHLHHGRRIVGPTAR